jgi:hypothetical protein
LGQTPHHRKRAGGEGWTRAAWHLAVRNKESDLDAVSLALVVLSQMPLSTETNQINRSGVLTSYDDAYHRAGQEGKPIFILFTTQAQPTELQQIQSQGLLNGYLVVVADRNTESGRKIFTQFNMNALEGVSVIERNRQWQFARYERKLNSDELTRVANACLTAVGYPTVDVLQGNFAAYPPQVQSQGGQPALPSQPVQPSVPYESFPQFQPQFQPMPMFGGFGGGCASGH